MIIIYSYDTTKMDQNMNIATTNVMVVNNTSINVKNVMIETVEGFVYLGQHHSLKENNQVQEIQRRIMSDTIWQRTAQDRLTWRRHAEAVDQQRDTAAAQ